MTKSIQEPYAVIDKRTGRMMYLVLTPNDDHIKDKDKYYAELNASMRTGPEPDAPFREDFMQALISYYMNFKSNIDLTKAPWEQQQ